MAVEALTVIPRCCRVTKEWTMIHSLSLRQAAICLQSIWLLAGHSESYLFYCQRVHQFDLFSGRIGLECGNAAFAGSTTIVRIGRILHHAAAATRALLFFRALKRLVHMFPCHALCVKSQIARQLEQSG